MPQIIWCPTGPLTFLPLHAAGIYVSDDPANNVNISQFVVSSYTPALSIMLSRSKSKQNPVKAPRILIVSQPATPNLPSLPGTLKEVQNIQKYISADNTTHITHGEATVDAVMSKMSQHEVVHLACHGIQDGNNPLDSSFALYDGKLKLGSLMTVSLEKAELAVLSACQTAMGNEDIPEEAVHLAAGMLAVGYPSVIATMWSIGDEDAPHIASKVYAFLFGQSDHGEAKERLKSAYALHEAVKQLRQEVGDLNFVKWVPFIHFGV